MLLEFKNIITSVGTSKNKRFHFNLNKYRNAHFQQLNKAKKEFNLWFSFFLMGRGKGKRFNNPVGIHYKLWLKKRTDLMNVGAVVDKFFQDAIVQCGIIPDDNPEWVKKTSFGFMGYEKKNRVDAIIQELK